MSRIVAVTATTVPEGGPNDSSAMSLPRVRVNVAYLEALKNARLIPVVIPPLGTAAAAAILGEMKVGGLLLTGGEDVDPDLFGETPHPKLGQVNRERDESEIALI